MKKVLISLIVMFIFSCTYVNKDNYSEKNIKLLKKGREAFNKKNFSDAKAYFELAYENGINAESLDALGCIALTKGALEEAKELFVRAIRANNKFALAFAHLAYLHEFMGEKEQARDNYLEAIKLNPNNIKIRNNFAAFLYDTYKEKDLKKARLLASLELKKAWIIAKENGKINRNLLELKKVKYEK